MKTRVDAFLLAGGLGTRLRPITLKVPKPLVPVRGRPFIDFLLEKIASMGVKRCVLLTGYKHGMVRRHCGSGSKYGMEISYSPEKKPLGTGGALLRAAGKIRFTTLVANGDSYLDVGLNKFLRFHKKRRALATILVMEGRLLGRGALRTGRRGEVLEFLEKQKGGRGFFNTGVYLIEPAGARFLLAMQKAGKLGRRFSMEKEGFPLLIGKRGLYSYCSSGRFVDIGTFRSLKSAGKIVGAKTAQSYGKPAK